MPVNVRRSTVIDAPVSAVWEVLRDFNAHDQWHPAVANSTLEEATRSDEIGAVRHFQLTSGERLREKLLTLSDRDHRFRYAIVDSEIPLYNYVAEVALRPVTDGNRTFWSWSSKFETPEGREKELADLVAANVYEAGFEAVRSRVESRPAAVRPPSYSSGSATTVAPAPAPAPSTGGAIEGTAMIIDRYGGAGMLHAATVAAPPPGPGEVRLRQTAVGVNFIDIYCRTGYFQLIQPPGAPGMEAAGEVIDVGEGVRHLAPGMRAAYACPPVGAYATVRTLDASLVVPLPDFIDDVIAAAGLLKGMSAEFLLHQVHPVKKGETVLVFAPAGGVGRLLCQWAGHLGATVIGATSSEAKVRAARDAGARHVIVPGEASLAEQVRGLTGGRGVDVVYDAVGRDTFDHSIAALAPRGHLVSYGQASGDIGARDISGLAAKSLTISRPNYVHYTDTPEKVAAITERLFDAIRRQVIRVEVGHRFKLSEAADAHRALEGRQTTGSIVLIPD